MHLVFGDIVVVDHHLSGGRFNARVWNEEMNMKKPKACIRCHRAYAVAFNSLVGPFELIAMYFKLRFMADDVCAECQEYRKEFKGK